MLGYTDTMVSFVTRKASGIIMPHNHNQMSFLSDMIKLHLKFLAQSKNWLGILSTLYQSKKKKKKIFSTSIPRGTNSTLP